MVEEKDAGTTRLAAQIQSAQFNRSTLWGEGAQVQHLQKEQRIYSGSSKQGLLLLVDGYIIGDRVFHMDRGATQRL